MQKLMHLDNCKRWKNVYSISILSQDDNEKIYIDWQEHIKC